MKVLCCANLVLIGTVSSFLLLPSSVQASKIQSSQAKADFTRANAVKASFQSSFNDYLKYAKGADELSPLSKSSVGGLGNWGATYIDALTTAHVMGLHAVVEDGVNFAKNVDFSHTKQTEISLFETNIRYLASLLSLYELTGKKDKALIAQAKVVGDHLLTGWQGANDIPYNTLLNWNSFGVPDTSTAALIAEGGTLLLEFDRLSKYTGDSTYLEHAERSMKAIISSKAVFPGLYGQSINPENNTPNDSYVTWGGGSDSFFEYLSKYSQLIGSSDTYLPTWVDSVKSSISHLLTRPSGTKANVLFLSDYNNTVIPKYSHLGCFAPGNWILGGKMLNNDDIFQYGLELAAGCIHTYTSTVTGIGPESFAFKTNSGGTNKVNIYDETFYQQYGFNYRVVTYVLRPEVLESVFYAYRTTGDSHWQDLAWAAFKSIKKHCKAPAALASLVAVNVTQPVQMDDSESFLYAELYKYLFLIFDDPGNISLDTHVFNTEGHPFELDNPNAEYSSIDVGQLPSPSFRRSNARRGAVV
ncbi:hypothetical protein CBS101457_002402 [Exobasidium rhododendri]|nr:hypothetical protein CBS101457_002402 [Exobasidium rhododendri]